MIRSFYLNTCVGVGINDEKIITQRDAKIDEKIRIGKINEEEETFHVKKVSKEFAKQIVQARLAKNWTQKDLARAMNETTNVIASFENGTAIYNPQMVQKFQKILSLKAYA